jgi:hypothetical protein
MSSFFIAPSALLTLKFLSSFKPDSYSFNSVIDAYSWSSLKGAAHRAEELYYRMKTLHESGDTDLQPDIMTLTSLHNAWERSDCAEAKKKMKKIRHLISKERKELRQN